MTDSDTVHSQTPLSPPAPALDADQQAQADLLKALLVTVQHFFGGFGRLFQGVTDPRHPAFITYPLPVMLATGVLMFLLHLGARRQVGHLLRNNGPSAAKFQAWFDTETCPHGDTLDATYSRLGVPEVQEIVTRTVETLIRNKVLYPYRLLEQYFLVVMDGTGTLTFEERHCPYCLTMTHHGHTIYYHPVLEAKLVTQAGLVCSLMTEFIENPGEFPTKQDCELKAFYRLRRELSRAAGSAPQTTLPSFADVPAARGAWAVRGRPHLCHLRQVLLEVHDRPARRRPALCPRGVQRAHPDRP